MKKKTKNKDHMIDWKSNDTYIQQFLPVHTVNKCFF